MTTATINPPLRPVPPAATPLAEIVLAGARPLVIPATVTDHASYLAWVHSDTYPEKAKTAWLDGTLWVETGMEDILAHVDVKGEIVWVLRGLVREAGSGYLLPDGALFTNAPAGVSNEPDVMFVSYDAVRAGRASLIPGKQGGFMEVSGTPDAVVEIVSNSSVTKDTVTLPGRYFLAGVPEFWLIDAREAELRFDLFTRGADAFVAVPRENGWVRSAAFGKEFRLDVAADPLGHPRVTLMVR